MRALCAVDSKAPSAAMATTAALAAAPSVWTAPLFTRLLLVLEAVLHVAMAEGGAETGAHNATTAAAQHYISQEQTITRFESQDTYTKFMKRLLKNYNKHQDPGQVKAARVEPFTHLSTSTKRCILCTPCISLRSSFGSQNESLVVTSWT